MRVPKSPGDETPSTDRESHPRSSFQHPSLQCFCSFAPETKPELPAQDLVVPPTLAGGPGPAPAVCSQQGQVSTLQSLSTPPAARSSLGSACILGHSPALCPLSLALGLRRSLNFLLKSREIRSGQAPSPDLGTFPGLFANIRCIPSR